MAVNVNETEVRYGRPAGMALPDLDDLPQVAKTARPDQEQLDAEYYDTSDLRLIRAEITLRRRGGPGGGRPAPATAGGCASPEAAARVTAWPEPPPAPLPGPHRARP